MPRIELIHPMIIHFPIALFLAAVGFEIISLFANKELFQKIAFANYVLASIAAILAVIFGTISANTIPHNETIHEIMEIHQLLGWITMGLFIVLAIWNYLVVKNWRKLPLLYWILVVIAAGSITWGATLGGEMVYNQGAAVQPLYEQFEEAEAGHHHHGESEEENHEEHEHTDEHSGDSQNHENSE